MAGWSSRTTRLSQPPRRPSRPRDKLSGDLVVDLAKRAGRLIQRVERPQLQVLRQFGHRWVDGGAQVQHPRPLKHIPGLARQQRRVAGAKTKDSDSCQ